MRRAFLLIMGLLMIAAGPARAPTIVKLLRSPIAVYDEKGDFKEKRDAKAILPPGQTLKIESFNGDRTKALVIVGTERLYLRNSDFEAVGVTSGDCEEIAQVAMSTSQSVGASQVGIRSGMAATSTACVPKAR